MGGEQRLILNLQVQDDVDLNFAHLENTPNIL